MNLVGCVSLRVHEASVVMVLDLLVEEVRSLTAIRLTLMLDTTLVSSVVPPEE
jgi:hypothetical protein